MKHGLSATASAVLCALIVDAAASSVTTTTGPSPTSSDPNVVELGHETYTAYYSGFTITEATSSTVAVLPTAHAVTIGTDTVSLGSAGDLVIDKSTTSLVKTLTPPVPNTVPIDGHTYIAYYSGFTITESGTPITVLPASTPVTVGTERVSLNTDGRLVLGSSTTSLLRSLPSSTQTSTHVPPKPTSKTSSTKTSSTTTSSKTSTTSSKTSSTTTSSQTTSKTSSSHTTSTTKTQSSTTAAPITTYSAYPTGFTATKVTTGVTTDGHTSSSKNGHVTIIPVIGGLSCWFCPHGSSSGGIQLPGLPLPGVFPPPPGPPGFSISANAPSITIDSEGNPTYSSKPTSTPSKTGTSKTSSKTSSTTTSTSKTSSSSSTCTKSVTASICTSSLVYEASGSSVTATSTTTKCQTTVACSATDSTTTVKTTSSSTASSTCVAFPVPSIIPEQADEDDVDAGAEEDSTAPSTSKRSFIINGRRSFVQRDQSGVLEKRVSPVAYRGPSQCSWGSPRPPILENKVAVKAPNYPAAALLNDYTPTSKVKGNAYLWLVTTAGTGSDSCDGLPWDYKQVDDSVLKSTKNAVGATYDYNSNTATGSALVNPDHVYEIKILKNFFSEDAPDSATSSSACDSWLKFWIAEGNSESLNYGSIFPTTGKTVEISRMQTLFKLLPGTANVAWSDFVGMDKAVNGMKGALLDNGITDITEKMSGNTPEMWIQTLNLMGLAQKVLHDTNVASRFATTNARIYGAMQQIDGITGDCAPPSNKYASSYSSWMGNYLSTQGAQIQSVYNSIVTTALPADKLTTTLTDSEGKSTGENTFLADKLAAVTKAFPVESMTYNAAQLLNFPAAPSAGQSISIKKRDSSTSAIPGSCAFTTSGASSTGTSSSASSKPSVSSTASKTDSSSSKTSTTSSASSKPSVSTTTSKKPTSTSNTTQYTATITGTPQEPDPSLTCDISDANSCAHVLCTNGSSKATCTADNGTGTFVCECGGE